MSWAGWNTLPAAIGERVQLIGLRAYVLTAMLWARCHMAPGYWLPADDAFIAGALGVSVKAWQDLRSKIAYWLVVEDGRLSFTDFARARLHKAWLDANSACGTPCRVLYALARRIVRVRSGKLDLERRPGESDIQVMERHLEEGEAQLRLCLAKFEDRDAKKRAFFAFIKKPVPRVPGSGELTAENVEREGWNWINAIKARLGYTLKLHLSRAALRRLWAAMVAGRCSFTMIAAAIHLPEDRFLAGWAGPDPPGGPA